MLKYCIEFFWTKKYSMILKKQEENQALAIPLQDAVYK